MDSDINLNINDTDNNSLVEYSQPQTYQDYVDLAGRFGANNILSEEDWNNRGSLRFLPPAAMSGLATAAGNYIMREAPRIAQTIVEKGPKAGVSMVVDSLKPALGKAAKGFVINGAQRLFSNTPNNGGGGGSNGGSYGGSTAGGSSGVSAELRGVYETTPFSLDLKPGLPAPVYGDTVNYPTSFASYCHLIGYKISLTFLDTETDFFYTNVLIPKLQNRAQQVVNFRVDLYRLSPSMFKNYINRLIEILSMYYFCTSLISYCSIPTNKDRGIWALRSMLTTTDLDLLEQIRDMLPAFPIPPNLNSLCFWLYQNFTDGFNGQNLIKFMPVGFNDTSDVYSTATGFTGTNSIVLKNLITNINTSDNMQLASLLTQVVPSWLKPNIMDPSPIPVYSSYFSTVFANAHYNYAHGGNTYQSPVYADNDIVNFISFDEVLDGLVLGLTSENVNTTGSFKPGLGFLVNTAVTQAGNICYTNRWSYVYKASINVYMWQPSNYSKESAMGRPDRGRVWGDIPFYSVLANSIPVKGVSIVIIRESAKSIVNWMLSLDSIPDRRKVTKIDKSSK